MITVVLILDRPSDIKHIISNVLNGKKQANADFWPMISDRNYQLCIGHHATFTCGTLVSLHPHPNGKFRGLLKSKPNVAV